MVGIRRAFYSDSISGFLDKDAAEVLGRLAENSTFDLAMSQRDAWVQEIGTLRHVLAPYRGRGHLQFEYSIPRLGKRIDVVALIGPVIFVLEFKAGEQDFPAYAMDQVLDYALDLKNFHEASHARPVAPVLIATAANDAMTHVEMTARNDQLLCPIRSSIESLPEVIRQVLALMEGPEIDPGEWERSRYSPTPTIVEAATALYGGHGVEEISRTDAGAINLSRTSAAVSRIISECRARSEKSICFVTGVPGAGKTLVGLNVATQHIDKDNDEYSVFLSGNGPLVAILREALARDKVRREKERGKRVRKAEAMSEVKMFIQNVHHFRDDCLADLTRPPVEHVALFDEAQRAWNKEQTSSFMRRKKGLSGFDQSEPEFLISCLDRHPDWAVIVCLVGGGQEINTGEAGITEWIESLVRRFPKWNVYISPRITDAEYAAGGALEEVKKLPTVRWHDELHLGVSMRSYRAEHLSLLVKQLLDLDEGAARETFAEIDRRYPLVLTRSLNSAKDWLKNQARGSERYGIVVSSQAQRLKPHAIDVRSPMDPIHWFLDDKSDVRSSYYLEDVATEFHVQGLELDWACVTWDADFRYVNGGWSHWSFCGDRWNRIRKPERQTYLKNAYRVLLTRARQGMVIVVPEGEQSDPTRSAAYYDSTFEYLRRVGFGVI